MDPFQSTNTGNLVDIIQPSNSNMLHKKQLSFRPSHKHTINTKHSSSQKKILSNSELGSDGESPRTSDEDSNPLGFHRNKLRSFSMRIKKADKNSKSNENGGCSVTMPRKFRVCPVWEESGKVESQTQQCQQNGYCTPVNTDFDDEIDMPDDALLLDHVPRKVGAEEIDSYLSLSTTNDHSTGRSCTVDSKLNKSQTSLLSEESAELETSSVTSPFLQEYQGALSTLAWSQSSESLDIDSVSVTLSDMCDNQSMPDPSRIIPLPLLSFNTNFSRPKSKSNEISVFRSCKGARGGSHFRVATSEYADRHMQFKTSMFQRQQLDRCFQSCAISARSDSPTSSVGSTGSSNHLPPHNSTKHNPHRHPNLSVYSKHNPVAETERLSHSPSTSSVSRSTPLSISCTQRDWTPRRALPPKYHDQEQRESGYISSSSESFSAAAH